MIINVFLQRFQMTLNHELPIHPFIYSLFSVTFLSIIYWQYKIYNEIEINDIDLELTAKLPFNRTFIYLTFANLLLNFFYYLIKLLRLVNSKNVRIIRIEVFIVVIFPMSLIVSSYFWTMAQIYPDYLWPKHLSNYFTLAYYHASHTTQVFTSIVEFMFLLKERSKTQKLVQLNFFPNVTTTTTKNLQPLTGFYGLPVFFIYNIWIITIRNYYDEWPYLFLEDLWSAPYHWKYGVFAVGTWGVSIFFAWILCGIYNNFGMSKKREWQYEINCIYSLCKNC